MCVCVCVFVCVCVCARVYVCVLFCDCELVSLIFSFSLSNSQSFVSLFLLMNARIFLHESYFRFGVPISLIVGSNAGNLPVIQTMPP